MGRYSRSPSRSKSRGRELESHPSYDPELDGFRVHIADLAVDCSQKELERHFGKFGEFKELWLARNPPCFAFCCYKHRSDAEEAIKEMDGRVVCNSRIRVSWARPRIKSRSVRSDLRCYNCGERGHFSRDCDRYNRPSGGRRSYRRSRSRSRSRSRDRYRRRSSYSRSRTRSRSRSRTPKKERSNGDKASGEAKKARSRSRSKEGKRKNRSASREHRKRSRSSHRRNRSRSEASRSRSPVARKEKRVEAKEGETSPKRKRDESPEKNGDLNNKVETNGQDEEIERKSDRSRSKSKSKSRSRSGSRSSRRRSDDEDDERIATKKDSDKYDPTRSDEDEDDDEVYVNGSHKIDHHDEKTNDSERHSENDDD